MILLWLTKPSSWSRSTSSACARCDWRLAGGPAWSLPATSGSCRRRIARSKALLSAVGLPFWASSCTSARAARLPGPAHHSLDHGGARVSGFRLGGREYGLNKPRNSPKQGSIVPSPLMDVAVCSQITSWVANLGFL